MAVESGLAAVVAERLDEPVAEVSVMCPTDVDAEPGATFACAVTTETGAAASEVAVPVAVGSDGEVTLRSAVVPAAAAQAYLAGELAGPAAGPVEVSCGAEPLLVVAVDDTFTCAATRADATAFVVTVTVEALDGTVSYVVEPA